MTESLTSQCPVNLPETSPEFEALLDYLKQNRGCDLTGYKRSTLMRQFEHRMQCINIDSYQRYLQYLQCHAEEHLALLNDVLINFTDFFRDRNAWTYLATEIIPKIISSKQTDESIRVWSAGCASGEETYSLAMLLAEALGIEQFQQRVQLYGTDVDPDAVIQARNGYYSAHAVEAIPAALREQYFERTTDGYLWRTDLRRSMIFQCHDLIQAPPFPRIDLLVCRNTFIYFTELAQIRALVRFHFSLRNNGFLLLGQTENLFTNAQRSLFTPVARRARVFTKVPDAHRNPRLLSLAFKQ
ncbi:protein-glutamate O-methyltransferase CheR [Chroococcidiopsis sp. CCMEE 29]|uniref:CheR family methyltransferase n=1 Tax=Chroococcidiopsis sp. CCMEE 29 TaxID=155894 RepID=UPI00201FC293|nr:protein-glutamate O-methyltransferase CheR [Chroococcidiopsis sp. CCMEE 29]